MARFAARGVCGASLFGCSRVRAFGCSRILRMSRSARFAWFARIPVGRSGKGSHFAHVNAAVPPGVPPLARTTSDHACTMWPIRSGSSARLLVWLTRSAGRLRVGAHRSCIGPWGLLRRGSSRMSVVSRAAIPLYSALLTSGRPHRSSLLSPVISHYRSITCQLRHLLYGQPLAQGMQRRCVGGEVLKPAGAFSASTRTRTARPWRRPHPPRRPPPAPADWAWWGRVRAAVPAG